MADTIPPSGGDKKKKVGRSPAYPFLSVQKAIDKARDLYRQESVYAAPLESALKAWGYGPKSSGGRQTLATMKYYGLIDITGEGEARRVKVSEVARRIILDQREDDTEKRQLIRKVAMTPVAHRALHEEFPAGLFSEGSVRHFLIFDQGFNEEAASDLLAEFRETASYIGLYEPQKTMDKSASEADDATAPPEVKVGDRVQATVNGQDLYPNGATVLGLSADGQWVFTDQSPGGLKLEEITVLEAAQTPIVERPLVPAAMMYGQDREPVGTRKAVFPVSEGDVALIFPKDITAEGLRELGMYLNIFLKKEEDAAKN